MTCSPPDQERQRAVKLTIIIPFFNEEENAPILISELKRVFSASCLADYGIASVHYLFVDDGSSDEGASIFAAALQNKEIEGTILCLSRNFGHQAALAAGLDHCEGDIIAIIDADLQDAPDEIPAMIKLWRNGADIVYGTRKKRKESWPKRLAYYVFYRILGYLSDGLIPQDSGDFSLFDIKVVTVIRQLPERIRFFRGLRAWVGFKQCNHEYERQARNAGTPKYTFRKLYKLATDGITSSSIRPLRITQVLCIVSFIFSAACVLLALVRLFQIPKDAEILMVVYALLAEVGMVSFFILLSLYIMSAYLGRLFIEVKGRPTYVTAKVVRF